MDAFLSEYVKQTRNEIDTEKRSRDNILNIVVLALGAVGFSLFKADGALVVVKEGLSLAVETAVLVTITGLFWLRRKKLDQIADRWFVLYNLLHHNKVGIALDETLEGIVIKELQTTRYRMKDFWLCLAVSCPVYALIAGSIWYQLGDPYTAARVICEVLVLHCLAAYRLTMRKFRCPPSLQTVVEPECCAGTVVNTTLKPVLHTITADQGAK